MCRPCSILSSHRSVYLPRFTLHLLLCSRVTLSVCRREEIRRERRMHRLMSSLPAYACHMTRTWSRDTHSTMEESCLQQKFYEKKTPIYYSTPFLTGKKISSKLVCWPEELEDKWSQKYTNFCRCRSCDFTDLNTTSGKQIPKCDWFS